MRHFIHSESGHNHANEDAVAVRAHPNDASVLLCALADGQGGQMGGATASQLAVERCLELAASYSVKRLAEPSTWSEILSSVDDSVSDEQAAGYATLVGLCIAGGKICGASCGDSAALLINDGQDSLLTERQRKNPPVGSGAAFPVAFSATLAPNFKVLVVSDGVWKYTGWDDIIQLCLTQHGQQLLHSLRRVSLEKAGGKLPDDFSVILLG